CLLELLLGLLQEGRRAEDARAVDEHVEATEALARARHKPIRGLGPARVAGDECGALAARVELGLRRPEHLLAAAVQDDARPLLKQAPRGRLADPAAAPGDECDLSFEVHLVLLSHVRVSGRATRSSRSCRPSDWRLLSDRPPTKRSLQSH